MLTVTPLVLTTPAHATPAHADDDNNTVELTISSDVNLKQSSTDPYLYDATTPVRIKANPRGFNLTIHADSADLVNTKDSNRRIEGTTAFIDKESGREMLMGMNPNSWGYRLEEGHGTKFRPNGFMHVPAGDEAPSVIVDTESEYDNAGCKGKTKCEVHMTFGAAIAPNSLAAGKYSTTVTYTATANWPQRTANPDSSDTCESGNTNSSCLVDLDPNMIPVIYNTETAEWESVANPENTDKPGEWYNYGNKQWANAVTVKNPQEYKGQAKPVKQSDILGFWVYIPRYAYEVMRRDGTDKPVPAQNFDIKFENTKTPPKRPLACKTKNDRDKDYRTQCGVSRELPLEGGEVSTWATHPAFTFGTKKLNELDVPNELNGIWFGKFETTGTAKQPTVLPNEAHISGKYNGMNNQVGNFYSLSKTLGINDPNNFGGSGFTTTQNNHHLARLSSHMVNNNDWGAATYLSASKYGAGYNKVQKNANGAKHSNYGGAYGTTGCGPQSRDNTSRYNDSGDLDTPQACGNADRAYNGKFGQLASTTNNVYGIYDMSGGGWEYVAASYGNDLNSSSTSYFSQAAHPPYVNTYNNITSINNCTFNTCGGQALYNVWLLNSSHRWFVRGGYYGGIAGILNIAYGNGSVGIYSAFRVALSPAPHD